MEKGRIANRSKKIELGTFSLSQQDELSPCFKIMKENMNESPLEVAGRGGGVSLHNASNTFACV